jgi:hypothetical protein
MKLFSARVVFCLILALISFWLGGCASSGDPDNASARPWNAPMGWENGLPSNLQEGR